MHQRFVCIITWITYQLKIMKCCNFYYQILKWVILVIGTPVLFITGYLNTYQSVVLQISLEHLGKHQELCFPISIQYGI